MTDESSALYKCYKCFSAGSVHDSTILTNSRIYARFENGEFPNAYLLGDAG
jgi:hypothetical protein